MAERRVVICLPLLQDERFEGQNQGLEKFAYKVIDYWAKIMGVSDYYYPEMWEKTMDENKVEEFIDTAKKEYARLVSKYIYKHFDYREEEPNE